MTFWDKMLAPNTLACKMWHWHGSAFQERRYGDIVADARRVASGLQRRGVEPGSIVPAVITNGPDAIAGLVGALFAGATVASLPIIARGMTPASYAAQLSAICRHLGASFLLAEERFLALISAEAQPDVEVVGYAALVNCPDCGPIEPPPLDEAMIIQFSSGTTAEPRGVILTGQAIEAHMTHLSNRVGVDPERDVGYTWLPLSHDMGLFGCGMLAWYNGMSGVIAAPERFLAAPRTWFDDCAEFGATVTAGPPFALSIAARAETLRTSGAPLQLRLCLVGAEQIPWHTLSQASDAFGSRGLSLKHLTPAYGLAEATLAVAVEHKDCEPSFVEIDNNAFAEGTVRETHQQDDAARRVVAVGTPLDNVTLRIDKATHEVVVRSSSLGEGYFRNDAATRQRFRDGELYTGDHGFIKDGRLYITGRSDDLLVIGGRNVHVNELEQQISGDSEIRTGNCALVDLSSEGRRAAVAVAEVDTARVDVDALATRLHRTAMEQAGLPVHHFVFLPLGTFPKTPSGKVQRYRCRELVADPSIGLRVTLGARSSSKS
jgi:fatty-acyl-CoA synthase